MDDKRLIEIIRKFVVVPWEIETSSGENSAKLQEIASHSAHMCGAGTAYQKCPEDNFIFNFLHPAAISVIIAFGQSNRSVIKDNKQNSNRWYNLSHDDRTFLLSELGFDSEEHESMLILCKKTHGAQKMASYVAVAFSTSTYVKSLVVPFSELARLAFVLDKEDDALYRGIVGCGLLIILGTGSGNRVGTDRIYGFVRELLDERVMRGDSHVFIDSAEESVLTAMRDGSLLHREQIEAMYRDIFPANLRMRRLLYGPSVYISPLAVQEASRRERGQAVIV
jgi:hypothetical protein